MITTAYQLIHTFDPFTGDQTLTGAMIIEGPSVRFVAAPDHSFSGTSEWVGLCRRHADSLRMQIAPWNIGPQIKLSGPMCVILEKWESKPGWSIDEWLLKAFFDREDKR